jgi:hypothetical protein
MGVDRIGYKSEHNHGVVPIGYPTAVEEGIGSTLAWR